MGKRAVVVGGGVVGLTSCLELVRDGWQCEVWSEKLVEGTTSVGAGAAWEFPPFLLGGGNPENAFRWVRRSHDVLVGLAADPSNGVHVVDTLVLLRPRSHPPPSPELMQPYQFRHCTPEDIGGFGVCREQLHAFTPHTYSYRTPVVHPPTLLQVLVNQLRAANVRFKTVRVLSLSDVARESGADLVVNCTGLGAESLGDVRDDSMQPIRGQVCVVRPSVHNPIRACIYDDDRDDGLVYAIPRIDGTVVVGGCREDGQREPLVREALTTQILERAKTLLPALKEATLVRAWSGVRPCRGSGVRLDKAVLRVDGRDVPCVHNYGHGGAGWALAFGCAEDVVLLARGQARL